MGEIQKKAKFVILKEFVGSALIDSNERDLVGKLKRAKPIFVYNAVKLSKPKQISKRGYLNSLCNSMRKAILSKTAGFWIECYNINSRKDKSARDIEVYIGTKLDKEGFKVDLKNPQAFAYLVIIDEKCYTGYTYADQVLAKFLNPVRHYFPREGKDISRSEIKLVEAFEEFGIERGNFGNLALDLGAAPGGWSKVLVEKGFKVISIDPGNLEIAKLKKLGIHVRKADKNYKFEKISKQKADLVYLKEGFKQAVARMKKLRNVSFVLNDMNLHPADSAIAVLSFRKTLEKDAKLIMTVKCPTKNVRKYIAIAKKELSKDFRIKGIKALPSNRQEVTLYAIIK